jgi:thiamine phosphate synthase YjbQ (UPF0047 family)
MEQFAVKTRRKREGVDVTDRVESLLRGKGAASGVAQVHVLHTTAAVTTADLDPGTDLDYLDAFEAMVPKLITVTRTTQSTRRTTSCRRS